MKKIPEGLLILGALPAALLAIGMVGGFVTKTFYGEFREALLSAPAAIGGIAGMFVLGVGSLLIVIDDLFWGWLFTLVGTVIVGIVGIFYFGVENIWWAQLCLKYVVSYAGLWVLLLAIRAFNYFRR